MDKEKEVDVEKRRWMWRIISRMVWRLLRWRKLTKPQMAKLKVPKL